MQIKEPQGLYLQSPKLNQLNLLREVSGNARITQAELANRCSLSVAMVNNYMKDLCNNDFLEYNRKSIKSVTYHLTSSGEQYLESLQTELIGELVQMFANAKEQIRESIMGKAKSSPESADALAAQVAADLVDQGAVAIIAALAK